MPRHHLVTFGACMVVLCVVFPRNVRHINSVRTTMLMREIARENTRPHENSYRIPELTSSSAPIKPGKSLSCYRADHRRTHLLMSEQRALPRPVLNLGMPKMGSSTLWQFFVCSGWKTNHWKTRKGLVGKCMRNANNDSKPILASCDSWKMRGKDFMNITGPDHGSEAYLQMDYCLLNDKAVCVFPQVQYLERMHEESPNATFVLLFRPPEDWFRSLMSWPPGFTKRSLGNRIAKAQLPGLPAGNGTTLDEMKSWWCWHVNRVRSFVDRNPSHALIELDLYDANHTAAVLATLFKSRRQCWGHVNANMKLKSS